jgi:large conductance mechanosensitive channel
MFKEFREFLTRGNVVDLAVAVILGAAFGAVVKSFVEDLITPIIAAIFGKPNFGALAFTINGSVFHYGNFLNAVVAFVLIGAAVFFFVVKPIATLERIRRRGGDPDSENVACTECLSEIPREARRCAFCGSPQGAAAQAA